MGQDTTNLSNRQAIAICLRLIIANKQVLLTVWEVTITLSCTDVPYHGSGAKTVLSTYDKSMQSLRR